MSKFQSEFKHDSSGSVGLSFVKVYNLWHKQIKDSLKEIQLTHPQFVVLASLGYLSQQDQEVNQVAISKKSDIDVMTISTIIRNLEKSGLISRKNSLVDTRAKAIVLTAAGQEKLTEALPIVEKIDRDFFGEAGTDVETLNRLLLQLVEKNS